MTRPQRLGILPTTSFWRAWMRSKATPVVVVGFGGLVAVGGIVTQGIVRLLETWFGALPGGRIPALLVVGYVVMTGVFGIAERGLRAAIRARRRDAARRARALGEEEIARSLEADDG